MIKISREEPCPYWDTGNKTCRRSQVPNDLDLISRKDALDEMQRYYDDCAKTSEYTRLGFETAMEVIKSLPSEVPSDLISRKAVLEWIQQSLSEYGKTYTTDMLNMWGLFEEQIKTFPPAEGVN